ncbi:MAG: Spo0E family sporulation regulatory protein-aspartic acid phosphatase [Dethiobacter sp.]|nr:MAG: Spo0E family sporulation regulatory protein-aspartic acid phosphatase [Dethiobacter sp.]
MKKPERNKKIKELHLEIESLKKTLQLKMEKYGNFCHPEVICVSKLLDQKILKFMKLVNNLDNDKH